MLKKLMLAVSVLVLVSGCKYGPKKVPHDETAVHGHSYQIRPSEGYANIVPGSQADLEVNIGDRIFFPFDSSSLDMEAQYTLDRQAEWLRRYQNLNLTVEGHCDERGTREYNLALGERRANAVKNYLVASGVDVSRITVVSYGKERPAVMGSGEEVFSQNRRGVTLVY